MKTPDPSFRYPIKKGAYHCPGIERQGAWISFTVAVPAEKDCALLLYKKGKKEAEIEIPMEHSTRYGDLRSVEIENFPIEKYEYNYRIAGAIVTDPYARRIAGRETWGQASAGEDALRGCIISDDFDWEGDEPLQIPYTDVIAYATHVRGFTRHSTSGVRAKGTFAGVQEKIPYLKALGINQLELMPVYEFAEVEAWDEKRPPIRRGGKADEPLMNYWGYADSYYFAPKASYAFSKDPVRELKTLVKELHKNGIELVLEFYFPKGIQTARVLDCIRYWVLNYHIDGVHVNRDHTPVEALAQEPLFSHTKIMSEGFGLDEIYDGRTVPAFRNLAEYNDGFLMDIRRFLKGDEGMIPAFIWRERKNPERHAVMNYLAGHNGFTLMDAVSYDEKHNEANGEDNRDGTDYNYSWNCGEEGQSRKKKTLELRSRQLRNALVMLYLGQGVPVLYGGDERGNSQSGNNNVYCQDNELSWIKWKPGKAWEYLEEYVRQLIAFRKKHPVFRQAAELRQTDYLSCGHPDVSYHGKRAWLGDFENYSRSVGILYAGEYVAANSEGNESDDSFYAAYNMHWIPHEFALPKLPGGQVWTVALDTGAEGTDGICADGSEEVLPDQRTVTVPERTILVLRGRSKENRKTVAKRPEEAKEQTKQAGAEAE